MTRSGVLPVRTLLLLATALLLSSCAAAFQGAKLAELDAAVERAIAAKKIPGAVLHVELGTDSRVRAYGNRALVPATEPMTAGTVFDAASITKVVATAPSVWLLVERGAIELDAPAKRYLPEMSEGRITIRHLLTHTAGLRPSLDLSEPWSGYAEGVRRATAETPRNAPGAVFRYSDIGFILLGEIVRRVSGEPLDGFAEKNVFTPLGMRDTRFLPIDAGTAPEGYLARIAPTERVEPRSGEILCPLPSELCAPGMLRGVVHDPTARRMGGVAGHAGVFTTAADLARYARALLGGRFPRGLTTDVSPEGVAIRRAGGFDLDSAYSRPRGDHFPAGSFGHTGWTGGFLWIDPASRAFYVFLSNRVHPDGKGSVVALQREIGTLVAESLRGVTFCGVLPRATRGPGELARDDAGTCPPRKVRWITGGADAQNGIDVLHGEGYARLRGMRVGLITNQSGIDRAGNPTIDLLRSAPSVTLAALFSPEHGIRGTLDEDVDDSVDPVTGLPVFSLYGERRAPSREQLAALDALVFDVQDVGARFYTYISTMGLAMQAAAEAKVKFVVLDRVNPIGGTLVEGPLPEGPAEFTAWHSLPVRHGMTAGELARMFRAELSIEVDLDVVPVRGWKREQYQDEAGLAWVNPSPNMRSLRAAALYPGVGLVESAVSVGRGTPTPFEVVGAPYVDGARLIAELGSVPGVAFEPIRFTPSASVHAGEECGGIRITVTDRDALRPVALGVRIAAALARLYPAQFPADRMSRLLRHAATLDAIRRGEAPASWDLREFAERRAKVLIY